MMCLDRKGRYWAKLASTLVLLTCPAATPRLLAAATYHVNPAVASAADCSAGTETSPWKTVARAAAAEELQPGDTVMIHSGVYREHVDVKVSGMPERPITFTAAPGARVVLKGSELVRGRWQKLAEQTDRKEPYPNAFTGVWRIALGDEFFTDARFQASYQDKGRRWVSQVFLNDNRPLQRIGPDPIYQNDDYLKLALVGRGLNDLIEDSFFFDPSDQSLYLKIAGEPAWFASEVGVRGFVLTAENVHDVVISGRPKWTDSGACVNFRRRVKATGTGITLFSIGGKSQRRREQMDPLESRNVEEPKYKDGLPAGRRREFLRQVGTVPVALAAARAAYGASVVAETFPLPQIRLGEHSVSRLICGDNPFKANSHLSASLNQHMRRYYTPDQIVKTLRRCEQVGINCWQASFAAELDLHRRYLAEGGRMQLIVIEAGTDIIAKAKDAGAIGVAHQGEATDHLFKSGQLDKVNEFSKQVRQTGMLVGVSTHMPAVVDAIESKGWDVDYYMTCVYERNRSAEELKKLLGHVPIPVSEVYLTEDPPRMFQAIRSTKRPCLAFKILAAGRFSWHREWVERAFRQTFQSIKPTDAVIVGIYNEFSDEPAENAELVRRYGA